MIDALLLETMEMFSESVAIESVVAPLSDAAVQNAFTELYARYINARTRFYQEN